MLINMRNYLQNKFLSRARNKLMMNWSNEKLLIQERQKREKIRVSENRSHKVIYYHQVDDPYSILVLPVLEKLKSFYQVDLECILVGDPPEQTVPEPSMYKIHCLNDVRNIARWYGQDKKILNYPLKNEIDLANKILSNCEQTNFIQIALDLMDILWLEESKSLEKIYKENFNSINEINTKIEIGNKFRKGNGYYSSSSFYYEGESYWGVDRLNHLENRLIDLGLKKKDTDEYIISRKSNNNYPSNQTNKLNLTIYPSLNSPYTFICFPRVRNIIEKYPVNIITKPVLPMLMRGMHIPRYKGKYILSDAAREGRINNIYINKIYSPLGKPAELAYSLFPIINDHNKGFSYIEKLTIASFHNGINIGNKAFLKKLVRELDLSWDEIKKDLGKTKWKKVLDENLNEMYEGNCWGVPSFRITDDKHENPFYQWGQDRLWLIEEEIKKRLD